MKNDLEAIARKDSSQIRLDIFQTKNSTYVLLHMFCMFFVK